MLWGRLSGVGITASDPAFLAMAQVLDTFLRIHNSVPDPSEVLCIGHLQDVLGNGASAKGG